MYVAFVVSIVPVGGLYFVGLLCPMFVVFCSLGSVGWFGGSLAYPGGIFFYPGMPLLFSPVLASVGGGYIVS